MKTFIIDIREEFELKKLQIIPNQKDIIIINIPSRHIQFNTEFINYLSKQNQIFIICRSGSRSNKAKKDFFNNNNNIIALDFGVKDEQKINNFGKIKLLHKSNSFIKSQGITQYMQLMFLSIITIHLVALLAKININYIMIFDMFLILFILSQVLTQSCVLTKILNSFNL